MKGSCLCGSVEFEVLGKLSNLYQCHCSLCQKATGTSACTSLITGANNVKWVKGTANINSFTKENGFRTDFCKICGSPLPNKMNIGEYMWIPAGLLNEAVDTEIVAHIHTASKATWDNNSSEVICYAEGPENIETFMNYLYNK